MRKVMVSLMAFVCSVTYAQIPKTLSFQGVLLDPATGQAKADGSYFFTFKIYNVASGGSALWTEQQTLTTSQGQYSVILGSVTPIEVTGVENYWLGISVDPTLVLPAVATELGRVKLTSSAYLLDDNLEDLADGSLSNSATTATDANTANAIVARNASGNFSAGTITANLTGNAATVTTNANLTGDVTSTGNATSIATGVIVNADINASAAIADTKLATISTAGKVSNSATTATNANTANTIVARDGSGNFSAGTITANLTGNASGTASNVTGTVAAANGGTGGSSLSVLNDTHTHDSRYYTEAEDNANFAGAGHTHSGSGIGVSSSNVSGMALTLNHNNGVGIAYRNNSTGHYWRFGHDGGGHLELTASDGPGNPYTNGFVFYTNGQLQVLGTTVGSDIRLKENISNIKYGLSEVLSLRGVSYQLRNRTDKNYILGLIAQEVQKVIPEVVTTAPTESKMLGINYDGLIPVLINAIQEQQEIINNQNTQIKTQNDRLAKIESMLKITSSTELKTSDK